MVWKAQWSIKKSFHIISVTLISNIEKEYWKLGGKTRENMHLWFFHIANFNPLNYANVHKGAFNNYVNQILPNFDPHPREWTKIDILNTVRVPL